MQAGSLTIGGTNAHYQRNYYSGAAWSGTDTAGLLMECSDNTELAVHDSLTRIASLMYYEGTANNKISNGRDMGWDSISTLNINGSVNIINTLQVPVIDFYNDLFDNSGRNHATTYTKLNAIDKFGYTFIQGSTYGPGVDTQFYSWCIGLGHEYPFALLKVCK